MKQYVLVNVPVSRAHGVGGGAAEDEDVLLVVRGIDPGVGGRAIYTYVQTVNYFFQIPRRDFAA